MSHDCDKEIERLKKKLRLINEIKKENEKGDDENRLLSLVKRQINLEVKECKSVDELKLVLIAHGLSVLGDYKHYLLHRIKEKKVN